MIDENEFLYNDQELETELREWEITPVSKGFASSYKTLYKTDFTTVAAKAFHIPNKETGEIHHFDLSLRVFKRRRKSDKWEEQIEESENEWGIHRQLDINAGSGKCVRELTDFLLAQYEQIGKIIDTTKVIVDKPEDVNIPELINNMNMIQKEEFGHGIKIQTLKEYHDFLVSNLDKNETFFQSWLDEDKGKYRKQRCLIFGLEFIDHKREGELARKRFDILTRTSNINNEYVIFELKSPCDDVFKIEETETENEGKKTTYSLSPQLARAIPQILHYKSNLEKKVETDDDLQRLGIKPGKVVKCIILIGKRYKDDMWKEYFRNLKCNFGNILEIWTYSDLIDKLKITIKNLEENL